MEPNETKEKSNGALLGLVVIVIILVIGGIYIWQMKVNKIPVENGYNTTGQIQGSVTSQDATSLDSLDQDLQNTDTDTGVDASTIN